MNDLYAKRSGPTRLRLSGAGPTEPSFFGAVLVIETTRDGGATIGPELYPQDALRLAEALIKYARTAKARDWELGGRRG